MRRNLLKIVIVNQFGMAYIYVCMYVVYVGQLTIEDAIFDQMK